MLGGRLILLACTAAVAVVIPVSATAATSCAQRVLLDWKDGKITGTYPTACYRQALATMPEDLRVYSSAPDDIQAALQQHLRRAAQGTRSLAASPALPGRNRPGSSTSGWAPALAVVGMAGGATLVLAAALGLSFRAGKRRRRR
jgi:hypothetical protein